jgi:hypothetical protein
MMMIIVLCILFISLIIHQRFYTVIEGKKGIGKITKVGGDIKKGAEKAAGTVEDKANQVGKGFKSLLNIKFIKFVNQLFTKDFLKKE